MESERQDKMNIIASSGPGIVAVQTQEVTTSTGADHSKASLDEAMSEKVSAAGHLIGNRRSRWRSSYEAFQYLAETYAKEDVKTRYSDKVTNICLLISIALATGWVLYPTIGIALSIPLELCLATSIVFYICNRFGVLSTLNQRQAVLVTELLAAVFLFAVLVTVNFELATSWLREIVLTSLRAS